jgi:hypothetical protein
MAVATVATFPGRGIIWQRMKSLGAEAKNIGWGTGSGQTFTTLVTGAASANVNLFGPATEARTAGTSSILTTTQLGDTYQVTGTITCATSGKTITEAALFDTQTPLSPTTTVTNSLATGTTVLTLGTSLAGAVGNFYAQIGLETVLVTGAAATSMTVTRGQLGTTAAAWAATVPLTMGGDGGAGGWTTGQTVNATSFTGSWGGNVFIHADFAGIALNVNDSISFTFSDTLT